ncbi:MAG TPA: carboxypeptidase-like regulatory domain-containing protein [Bryobacteraceae bacterium]
MYRSVLTLLLILSALAGRYSSAQSIYATLTGLVTDASEAVVPNAKVTVTNTLSGDVRRTVTNAEGYFTVASLPVGTYKVTVEAAGFVAYELTDLQFTGAEKRNLNIVLNVGATTEKVEVSGVVDLVTPVDSGEKAAVLTTKQL